MARPKSLRQSAPSLWRMMRRFWPEIRQHRRVVGVAFIALLAEVALRVLEPWPLKFVFDRVIPSTSAGGESGVAAVDSLDPMTVLVLAAMAVVVITGMRALAAYASTVGFALAGNRIMTKLRNQLYNHIQCLPLSFHNKARNGDLIVRVIGDVGLLQEVTVTAALPLLGNLLVLVAMMAVMVWLNWQLALLALATMPVFALMSLRLGRRIREVSRKQRRTESDMAATAAESLSAIKTVQALSLQEAFADTFSSNTSKSLKEGVKAKRLSAGLERTVDLMIAIATALVLWYGALLVMRSALTPGDLIVFLAYLKTAFRPLRNFAKYTGRLAKAAAAAERVMGVLDNTPEVRDLPNAVPAPAFSGKVEFDGVGFAYEPSTPVLKSIDLTVEPGQHVALIAPSGAGKSTLVGLLLRLYDPSQGQILIDGKDIRAYTLDSLRPQLSIVLQDTLLFAASVRDNIAYGASGVTPEEIEAAARLANAHGFITSLPEGYDTVLGERGATLSNGQRQRIAIARAAVRKSPILILDEPTAGLDKENEREVTEALRKLAEGRTTFIITHDLHLAIAADYVVYLDEGRIRERGTHSQLVQAGGQYAKLFQVQKSLLTKTVSTDTRHAQLAGC